MDDFKLEVGEAFAYRYTDGKGNPLLGSDGEAKIESFFFTGETDNRYGEERLVMCKWVSRPEEVTMDCFMLITRQQFKDMLDNGTIVRW